MISCLTEHGRVGLTAVGNTRAEAQALRAGATHPPRRERRRARRASSAALWRADLFDLVGAEPGNFRRAHHHPTFAYTEPTDRVWDHRLTIDPMSWIVDRLQSLAATLDDHAKAELDLGSDQQALLGDLETITGVISRRLGGACPSLQACLSQTSDVRYLVPAMLAQLRGVPHGIDPRHDASSWADVVARRDRTLRAER
jgi:hypothetical protein